MKAVVILPTYNEKENIAPMISLLEEEVFPKIKNYDMGILVADDTSPDGTADIVRDLMKKYKNLDINQGHKAGLGAAYLRGMTYAIEKMDADVVFEMDADGQHDATKIPEFLKKIDEGYDFVIGTRYSAGGSIPDTWGLHRKLLSVCGNLFIRTILMRFSIHDWTGGFRAITKEVFLKEKDKLKNFTGYTFQVGSLLNAVHDGFKVGEVPFHFSDRTKGKSKIPGIETIFKTLSFVIEERTKELVFGSFGKFLVVGGIGFVLNYVVLRVLHDSFNWDPFWANLVGAALAIFSNYNLNNIWTFRDQKISGIIQYLWKMLQFYATSAFGVIFIQSGTIFIGDLLIKPDVIFHLGPLHVRYYILYFLLGTFFILIWNFFIYSKFIWKKKAAK